MDRATMTYAKLTISCCMPCVISTQQALRAIFNAHCYTDQQLRSLYVHGEAQTPLGRFVVDILYEHVCNKCTHKSNQWSLSLSA